MSMKLAAARGIIWTSVDRWGRQFLGIAVFTMLARILGKEEFGLVALAGVYIAFVQMFITQGLGEALVQRKELKPSHVDVAFWLTIILALLLAALTITFRNSLAIILENERVAPVLAWLAVGIPLMALNIVPDGALDTGIKVQIPCTPHNGWNDRRRMRWRDIGCARIWCVEPGCSTTFGRSSRRHMFMVQCAMEARSSGKPVGFHRPITILRGGSCEQRALVCITACRPDNNRYGTGRSRTWCVHGRAESRIPWDGDACCSGTERRYACFL